MIRSLERKRARLYSRNMKKIIAIIALVALPAVAAATPFISHLPAHGLGDLLARQFDLASIRSSLGPSRSPGKNTFASLGIWPSLTQDTKVVFDDPSWYFAMTVLRRGDFNKDGVEDLEVCFVNRAKRGSYNAQQALLVTRYAPDASLVALAFSMDGCKTFAR